MTETAQNITIWADDLSGATAVTAPFTEAGLRTLVVSEPKNENERKSFEVVCFNTDSRDLVNPTFEGLPKPNLLKVDSLGRGHIEHTIKSVCKKYRYKKVVIAPAWPEQKRVLREGVGSNGFDWGAVTKNLETWLTGNVGTSVSLEANPEMVATEMVLGDEETLFVGTQGLATAFAKIITKNTDSKVATKLGPNSALVAVFGSFEGASTSQKDALISAGWESLTLKQLLKSQNVANKIAEIKNEQSLVIDLQRVDSKEQNSFFKEYADELVSKLKNADLIFATGGATAMRLLNLIGAPNLENPIETESSIAVSVIQQDGKQQLFATQPGSVGNSDDVLQTIRKLKDERNSGE